MRKKYVVRLADAERVTLTAVIRKLSGASQTVRRAWVLLKADADGPCWTDARIADAGGRRAKTVEDIRERFVAEGFETAPKGKRDQPARPKLLGGRQEAQIIALRLGRPPAGFADRALRLLADEVVGREIAPAISHETVRRTLKKTG